ncbi:MAG: alpha/beta hydrolase [Bacteroidetes bacterium]|nr:alpha/beta hydrolase [Bacteroidota bacterium]
MKKLLFSFLFLCFWITSLAQDTVYKSQTNVQYYANSINDKNSYMNERCVLDIYYPANIKNFATVIWFHGGGLTEGSKEIPEALKKKGLCVVGVEYRLTPNVSTVNCIEDAAAAVAWVYSNISKLGGDTNLLFLSGHSAGAYLSMMLGLDKKWLMKYTIDANHIAGLIPFSGQCITHFAARKEKGMSSSQPLVDELAPLYYVRADAPPLFLMTGDRELELWGRYEENAYMMRMMKVAGHNATKLIEFPGYDHAMTAPAFPLLLAEVSRIVALKVEK